MTKEDVYYVEIPNPVDFRRSVLEASREMLRGLQKNEDLKKIRARKAREISNLKGIIREINTLLNKSMNALPSVSVRAKEAPKQKKEKPKQPAKSKAKSAEAVKKPREVTELEHQLKEIEGKLARLG